MATEPDLPVSFEHVPVRYRHDGWTPQKQFAFLEKLADCGSITIAARHVGMSREAVRKLRRHPRGGTFRDAVDAALDCGYAELEESAKERATHGVARPIFYKGEQVGEWRHHDERLTMFLLRFRRRQRFGVGIDVPTYRSPIGERPEDQRPFDPEDELLGCLQGGEFDDLPYADGEDPKWNGRQS